MEGLSQEPETFMRHKMEGLSQEPETFMTGLFILFSIRYCKWESI